MFHSAGIFQSNTFVPDLILLILRFEICFFKIDKVSLVPLPVILRVMGKVFSQVDDIYSFILLLSNIIHN